MEFGFKRARCLSYMYDAYNTLLAMLQVLEHALNQNALQRRDNICCQNSAILLTA